MQMFWRVPLSRLNLTHDKLRLGPRVAGTAFAVFLLFVELGFWDALLEGSVQLIRQFNGDLIVVSRANYSLVIKEPFPRRSLDPARAVAGVTDVFPVYLEHPAALWKNVNVSRPNGNQRASQPVQPIRVIAFYPDQCALKLAEVNGHRQDLKLPYNVLLDDQSKPKSYGKIEAGIDRELAGHTIHVAGLFTLGTDFANDGNVIMSAETFARLFAEDAPSGSVLDWPDIGVVQIEKEEEAEAICRELSRILPKDVRVFTKNEFIKREMKYWSKTTPMGFIFFLGLCLGFVVGVVICVQIISTDVAEHLPQYATLKAMGYSDAFLRGIVLGEALWLGALGFAVGLGMSRLAYWWLSREIDQPMELSVKNILYVLLSTVVMCMASGLIALRKVQTADPAEVFA